MKNVYRCFHAYLREHCVNRYSRIWMIEMMKTSVIKKHFSPNALTLSQQGSGPSRTSNIYKSVQKRKTTLDWSNFQTGISSLFDISWPTLRFANFRRTWKSIIRIWYEIFSIMLALNKVHKLKIISSQVQAFQSLLIWLEKNREGVWKNENNVEQEKREKRQNKEMESKESEERGKEKRVEWGKRKRREVEHEMEREDCLFRRSWWSWWEVDLKVLVEEKVSLCSVSSPSTAPQVMIKRRRKMGDNGLQWLQGYNAYMLSHNQEEVTTKSRRWKEEQKTNTTATFRLWVERLILREIPAGTAGTHY